MIFSLFDFQNLGRQNIFVVMGKVSQSGTFNAHLNVWVESKWPMHLNVWVESIVTRIFF